MNASAPQLTQPQDSTLAPQPAVPNASVPQSTGPTNVAVPTNVSASGPTYHQQNLAMLIQPKSPTEVLMSRFPHGNGVTWIFHDPTTSFVHHVNVPYNILWHSSKLIRGQHKLELAMRWSYISHHLVKSLSMLCNRHRLFSQWLRPVRNPHRQLCLWLHLRHSQYQQLVKDWLDVQDC